MPAYQTIKDFLNHAAATAINIAKNIPPSCFGVVLIVILIFITYWPSIHGDFLLDDNVLITDNHLVHAPDGLYRMWFTAEAPDYWPVTNSTLWMEWRLWGKNPTGYRITNLVLYIFDVLLVWLVLFALDIPGAFLAALLFAVHPINVESVAWISQCKNVLSLLFFLCSVWCYFRFDAFELLGPTPGNKNSPSLVQRAVWYGLSLTTFLLAMLSKGSVAVLPILILLYRWWRTDKLAVRDIVCLAPFFLVAGVLSMVNIWFQKHNLDVTIRNVGFLERILGAGAVVWFYLYKAIWPVHLAFAYPQWQVRGDDWRWWLPLVAVIVITAALYWFRNGPKGRWIRAAFFAWSFFCISLVPVMGLVDVGFMKVSLVADHYQYIALLGVVTATATALTALRARLPEWAPVAAKIATAGMVAALAFLTLQHNRLYASAVTLYEDTLEQNPDCWLIHDNLGLTLIKANQVPEAITHFQEAVKLSPTETEPAVNLGIALAMQRQLPAAIEQFQHALLVNPNDVRAHYNLGKALRQSGRSAEAIDQYLETLRLNPNSAETQANLAILYAETNRRSEAIEAAEKAWKLALQQGENELAEKISAFLKNYQGETIH